MMQHKTIRLTAILALVLVAALALTACVTTETPGEKDIYIRFDAQGGSEVDAIKVEGLTKIEWPTPTRKGYEFAGWYLGRDYKTRVDGTDYFAKNPLKASVMLYAKWTAAGTVSVVTLDVNGGKALSVATVEVADGKQATFPVPEKEGGYRFVGWYTQSEGGTQMTNAAGQLLQVWQSGSITLYAHWAEATYTVTLKSTDRNAVLEGGGTGLKYGTTVTVRVTLTGGTREFSGWFADNTLYSSEQVYTFIVTKDITLIAVWKDDGDFGTVENSDGTLTIVRYDGPTDIDLYIPDIIDGKKVTAIGTGVFENADLNRIYLPYSVRTIGARAFRSCDAEITFGIGSELAACAADAFDNGKKIRIGFSERDSIKDVFGTQEVVFERYGVLGDTFVGEVLYDSDDYVTLVAYALFYGLESATVTLDYAPEITSDEALNRFVSEENAKAKTYLSDFDYDCVNLSWAVRASLKNGILTLDFTFEKAPYIMATQTTPGGNRQTIMKPYVVERHYDDSSFVDETLPIEDNPRRSVETSEQMLYAVEHGYKPIFPGEFNPAYEVYWSARRALAEIIKPGMTKVDQAHAIYDYLTRTVVYDSELLDLYNSVGGDTSVLKKYRGFYLEGALLDEKSVCDGIAKAYSLMCNMMEITAIRVSGNILKDMDGDGVAETPGTAHAWNKIRIDKQWYVVDATSGSPIMTIDGTRHQTPAHNYFMINDQTMAKTHRQSADRSYPAANGTNYDYYSETKMTVSAAGGVTKIYDLMINTTEERAYVLELFAASDRDMLEIRTTLDINRFGYSYVELENIGAYILFK